ncbi:MAG: flagellar hook-length control protein FliK [Planctomycetota bacterium]|jgi:hypothetical protein
MIPDFLQNPGNVPKTGSRPAKSDSTSAASSTPQSDTFARALRDAPATRNETRHTNDAEPVPVSERTDAPAPSNSRDETAQVSSESRPASSARSAENQAGNKQSRLATDSDNTANAAGGKSSDADRATSDQRETNSSQNTSNRTADRSLARNAAQGPREDAVSGEDALPGNNQPENTGGVQRSVLPAAGEPTQLEVVTFSIDTQVDVAAALQTDDFAQQADSTTSTDAELQLDTESDPETAAADTVPAGAADTPQIAIHPASEEHTGPLILASLVSIAIADSPASRRQQQAAPTPDRSQQHANTGTQSSDSSGSTTLVPGEVSGAGGPIHASEELTDNPVLPSLAALKSGKRLKPAVGTQSNQQVSVVQSQTSPDAAARSADTPPPVSGLGSKSVAQNSNQSGSQNQTSSSPSQPRQEVTPSTLTTTVLPHQGTENVDGNRSARVERPVEQPQQTIPAPNAESTQARVEAQAFQSRTESEQTAESQTFGTRTVQSEQQSLSAETQTGNSQRDREDIRPQVSGSEVRQVDAASSSSGSVVLTDDADQSEDSRRTSPVTETRSQPNTSANQPVSTTSAEQRSATKETSIDREPPSQAQFVDGRERTAASQTREVQQIDSPPRSDRIDRSADENSFNDDNRVSQSNGPADALGATGDDVENVAASHTPDTSAQQSATQSRTVDASRGSRSAERDRPADSSPSAASASTQSAGPELSPVETGATGDAARTVASNPAADTSVRQPIIQVHADDASRDSLSADRGRPADIAAPSTSAASQLVAGDSPATLPFAESIQPPASDGGERFLSPNVQRALTAIQSAASGGSRLRVHLNPPELGSLMVDIVQTPQGIIARLEVATPAAQQMLIDSLADLQQSLSRTQSPVERIDVVLNDVRPETSRQQREHQQQRGQNQQQRDDADSQQRRQQDERRSPQQRDESEDGGSVAEAA